MVWYGMVWCGVVWCGVVWCGVVWCGVVWCGVVWCGVVWCGVVWCGIGIGIGMVTRYFTTLTHAARAGFQEGEGDLNFKIALKITNKVITLAVTVITITVITLQNTKRGINK
jgi:hypothetical protein